MTDKIKIIQDISLLYELSLSVGSTLDPRENCHRFLRTLISRKSLNFGAVWLNRVGADGIPFCDLFFIHPHFRESDTTVACSHYILQELSSKPYVSITSQDLHFNELLHEKKVGKGAYAVFRLGELGFLKLFASNRPTGFDEMEMAQLKQVVDKLKISLDGCFAHIQLKEETEHRLVAQRALEESENKLRRIIDSSLDAVVSVSESGHVIEWNVQAEKMFGHSRKEALGQDLIGLIIPEQKAEEYRLSIKGYLPNAYDHMENKRYEITCVRKNGKEFPTELSFTIDKNSNSTLFVGFLRDITEQRDAEMKIEQSRVRIENLIANLQAGILLEDSERKIALVNQSFCDIFEIPVAPELLLNADCSQSAEQAKHLFVNPAEFVNSINNIVKNKTLVENEILFMTNGRILERDYVPLYSGAKYQGHLWQYRDITERQNAQQAIRESEEKYRGVLENMTLGLLEVDTEENIIRTNNAFCQMLGFLPEDLIGRNTNEVFLPEASNKIISERLEERKRGESSVYELQVRRKDGSFIWLLISGAPLKNSLGQTVGSIGIQFDLTERKKLEHELAEAKLAADRARLAERQFLTHMSHEIRTPINAVIGMTHLLYETKPDEVQRDYLDGLRFSADSLLGIIDNILDLSKIDAGEIEFEQKPFDLDYLLKSLLRTFHFKVKEKDIQIVESIDPSIQNLVVGDPTRINQILTNLLGNALKFTEKGLIGLSTKLLNKSAGRYVIEFRVHDTGIGIPEDKRETIFEYFKQADVQINRKFGGTGLGLTIVKQLVEMQGGTIHLESQIGVGSDFVFTLSFGDSGIPVYEHSLAPKTEYQIQDDRISGLHFLIVEDNLLNQKLICKTIQTWGCTFDVASNGLEALTKTAAQRFDIILMDIHMPHLDGCETTSAIRNDKSNPNRQVPIIALTAAAMSEERRRAFEVGMNGFLTKPISPKMLLEHLLLAIQQKDIATQLPATPSNPSPANVEKQIDFGYLLDLSNGDKHFVNNIIDTFLIETPTELEKLKGFVKKKDWGQVRETVHKMKSNFALMGMRQLQERAAKIEGLAKSEHIDTAQITSIAKELISQTNKALLLLSEERVLGVS